jgi:cytochrome c oxidase subunit 1/cytochrome c oxidase subunit I+III
MALGFGVWVHHMFATGLPSLALAYFSGASLIITIPSAVAVFAWTATIWTGRPVIRTAFLFFASMIVLFVIGGVSGVMTASTPVDWQLTQTYFIVAHLHYVLIGINVFPVVGAVYYWFPKMTGRLLDERLGQVNFWTMFVGFNLGFMPMHVLGLMGMPRRVYTYGSAMGWGPMNMIVSLGSFLFAAGVLLFFINIAVSLKRGRVAGADPWGAATLEWAIPSPPPAYNFAVIPTIESRHPLWEHWLNETPARSRLDEGFLLDHGRETVGTTALDARPNLILEMPTDSLAPFFLTCGLATGFVGALLHAWWIAGLGVVVVAASLVMWFWPRRVHSDMDKADG